MFLLGFEKCAEPTQRTADASLHMSCWLECRIPYLGHGWVWFWVWGVLSEVNDYANAGVCPSSDFGCCNLLLIVIFLRAQAADTPRDLCMIFRVCSGGLEMHVVHCFMSHPSWMAQELRFVWMSKVLRALPCTKKAKARKGRLGNTALPWFHTQPTE